MIFTDKVFTGYRDRNNNPIYVGTPLRVWPGFGCEWEPFWDYVYADDYDGPRNGVAGRITIYRVLRFDLEFINRECCCEIMDEITDDDKKQRDIDHEQHKKAVERCARINAAVEKHKRGELKPQTANPASITLTLLKNPFNTAGREIKHIDYIPEKTIEQIVQPYAMGLDDFIYSANGAKVEADYIPMPADYIAVCPIVGKSKWLGQLLTLGLTIWTGGMSANWIAGGMSKFAAGLLATAVTFVGGQLISHLFPQPSADYDAGTSSTPTYGWGALSAQTTQGGILPRTYGTMRTAGIELARRIETVGDKQYLNLLLCGGQGPIDSISDIKINDNPIGNYSNVVVETRLGTNDQTVISNFNDQYDNQALSYELQESGWSTHLTEGNAGQGLEVSVEFPNGLYHMSDSGSLETASVTLAAEYRLEGGTWVSWFGGGPYIASTSIPGATCYSTAHTETWTVSVTEVVVSIRGSVSGWQGFSGTSGVFDNGKVNFTVPSSEGTYTIVIANDSQISAAQNTAVRRSFRIDNIVAGRYEVRVKVASRSAPTTSTKDSVRVYWTQLSHIIYDDFCRPGKVLVSVKALATDQLNGSDITVTWNQTVDYVWVWEPHNNRYNQGPARNLAFVCYDMIHGCRRLKNIHTGEYEFVVLNVPANRIDYTAFIVWAVHCETLGLEFEHIFDTATDLWNALKIPESFGRGKVIMQGTKFSCICDKPKTTVQLFNVGNIDQGSFSKEFLGLTDRANAIEITFVNKDKGYQKDCITVYGDNYNASDSLKNPTQITLTGCTSYQQAYQHGKYLLRVNKYLLRTITWDADIDAIACQTGDQVLIQHDLPEWGRGGRIAAATTTVLTLDRPVVMESGKTYGVHVRLQDDSIINKYVTNTGNETTTLTVTTPFASAPTKYDMWVFGEITKEAKPFIVIDVDRKDDLSCTLTGIEYVPAIYEESLDAPVINYSSYNPLPEITSLSLAEENYRQPDGTSTSLLHASWSMGRNDYAESYMTYYSVDRVNWNFWERTHVMKSTISTLISGTEYHVKVCTANNNSISQGVIESITVTGSNIIPPDVTGFLVSQLNGWLIFEWNLLDTPGIKDYEIWEYDANNNARYVGRPITSGYRNDLYTSGNKTFAIWARDSSGNYSVNPDTYPLTVADAPYRQILTGMTYLLNAQLAHWDMHDPTKDMHDSTLDMYQLLETSAYQRISEPIDLGSVQTFNIYVAAYATLSRNTSVSIQIALSNDGATFGAWQTCTPGGSYSGRAVDLQVLIQSLDGSSNVTVEYLTVDIFVPESLQTVDTAAEQAAALQADINALSDSTRQKEFTQSVASAVWVIVHNMGRNPTSVVVYNSDNTPVGCNISYSNLNQMVLTFNGFSVAGKAYYV